MKTILDENSVQEIYDDDIISDVRATSIGYRRENSFRWCESNRVRSLNIDFLTSDVLSI